MIQENVICAVCDHQIVPGVACDGMPGDCPTNRVAKKQQQPNGFALAFDRVAGENEFDCIKGID